MKYEFNPGLISWDIKRVIDHNLAMYVSLFQSPYLRKLRRTIMRYVNVSSIIAFTNITRKLHDQYPNYQSFIGKKLLLPHEVISINRGN